MLVIPFGIAALCASHPIPNAPWIVDKWDTDFPLTEEGVKDFEDEYPGVVDAILDGFHKARRKEAEKLNPCVLALAVRRLTRRSSSCE